MRVAWGSYILDKMHIFLYSVKNIHLHEHYSWYGTGLVGPLFLSFSTTRMHSYQSTYSPMLTHTHTYTLSYSHTYSPTHNPTHTHTRTLTDTQAIQYAHTVQRKCPLSPTWPYSTYALYSLLHLRSTVLLGQVVQILRNIVDSVLANWHTVYRKKCWKLVWLAKRKGMIIRKVFFSPGPCSILDYIYTYMTPSAEEIVTNGLQIHQNRLLMLRKQKLNIFHAPFSCKYL